MASGLPLAGRVAVVTGGSRGLGRGIALRLAADGADCAITYRTRAAQAGEVVAAMESLVRSLAVELGPRGITVNGVSPGLVDTDSSRLYLTQGLGRDWDEAVARMAAATPVGRFGTIDEIASLVAYLASPDAGFITGQTIVADGGLTITSPLARLVRR